MEHNMSDLQVARIIAEQLGGSHFRMMTGARDLVAGGDFLQFNLPADLTHKGISKVRITLTPMDWYKVEFYAGLALVDMHDEVYCDTLRDMFERVTGLYTSLTPRRRVHHFVDKKA
jgi:hypothetical protein